MYFQLLPSLAAERVSDMRREAETTSLARSVADPKAVAVGSVRPGRRVVTS